MGVYVFSSRTLGTLSRNIPVANSAFGRRCPASRQLLDGIRGEPHGIDELLQAGYDKFRRIGAWRDERGTLGLEGL